MFLILPVAIVMGQTGGRQEIHPKRPSANLVSRRVIIALVGHIAIFLAFQTTIFFSYKKTPMVCITERDEYHRTPENTALFLFSSFQYIWIAIIYSTGYPYRASIFSRENCKFQVSFLSRCLCF